MAFATVQVQKLSTSRKVVLNFVRLAICEACYQHSVKHFPRISILIIITPDMKGSSCPIKVGPQHRSECRSFLYTLKQKIKQFIGKTTQRTMQFSAVAQKGPSGLVLRVTSIAIEPTSRKLVFDRSIVSEKRLVDITDVDGTVMAQDPDEGIYTVLGSAHLSPSTQFTFFKPFEETHRFAPREGEGCRVITDTELGTSIVGDDYRLPVTLDKYGAPLACKEFDDFCAGVFQNFTHLAIHTVSRNKGKATSIKCKGLFVAAEFVGPSSLYALEAGGHITEFRLKKDTWVVERKWDVRHPTSLYPRFTSFAFGLNNMLFVGSDAGLVVMQISHNWTKLFPFGHIDCKNVQAVCPYSKDGLFVTSSRGLEAWTIVLN